MLNDVKIPPAVNPNNPTGAASDDAAHMLKLAGVKPHEHIHPTIDPKELGIHKTRVMGEPTKIDPIYAMPMEDRGSFFSLTLSAVVVGVSCLLLIIVWLTMFRG